MSVRSRRPRRYRSPIGKSGIADRGRRLPPVGPILAYLMTVPGEVRGSMQLDTGRTPATARLSAAATRYAWARNF